ncbi:MAG TPA: AAA family ATPase [Candidatus Limnocylindria bacterium]|nr:AAA family ATPase [Candidatus Limnocylindria bacterium]
MQLLERDRPLSLLSEAHAAASDGRGSVVLLAGEAGIGKTSLVNRFAAELGPQARLLLGMCDDLRIPRPLGPLRNLAGAPSAELVEAIATARPATEVGAALLAELERAPQPGVLVLEDVHWADEATLDAVTVVARRIEGVPALLLLTFRPGEIGDDHPLRSLLGAVPAAAARHIALAPLSREGVASLAGEQADEVYVATGGNPFFVVQLLAAGPGELPPSVANAVLAQAARLDPDARRLVELVSVVPSRIEATLVDAIMPGWAVAAEEPERRGLLEVGPTDVRFRHELARLAIRSSVPVARRRRLHAEVLAALRAAGADAADIVHHAEAAGDLDAVAEHALVAGRQAAAVGANREAYAHFRRAADFADRLDSSGRATLFEELAGSAYVANQVTDALAAIERAISIHVERDDRVAIGRCTRLKSRIHWYAGDGAAALDAARSAVAILEPIGPSGELARAYSALSQLAMLAGRVEETVSWGERAVNLATTFGDDRGRAHALINIGLARAGVDPDDTAVLMEGYRAADAAGDRHEATRALLGLSGILFEWVRPAEAIRIGDEAIAYAERYQVDTLLAYLKAMRAWMHLRAGEWAEAERLAWAEIERDVTVAQLVAKTVLAALAVRRGDADAAERLAEVVLQADRTGELQHIVPVLEIEVARSMTTGEPMPVAHLERALTLVDAKDRELGWDAGRLVAWARSAGLKISVQARMPAPHAAIAAGDWRGAADAFGAVGWTYDRALFLLLLEDEAALAEALEVARDLDARPLADRVTTLMRDLGYRIPRGVRESTRANPMNLTDRQLEVLRLLAEGLTNAEIAERLVVSPRTAEHHVAAVLGKLDAASRREAVRSATALGMLG